MWLHKVLCNLFEIKNFYGSLKCRKAKFTSKFGKDDHVCIHRLIGLVLHRINFWKSIPEEWMFKYLPSWYLKKTGINKINMSLVMLVLKLFIFIFPLFLGRWVWGLGYQNKACVPRQEFAWVDMITYILQVILSSLNGYVNFCGSWGCKWIHRNQCLWSWSMSLYYCITLKETPEVQFIPKELMLFLSMLYRVILFQILLLQNKWIT